MLPVEIAEDRSVAYFSAVLDAFQQARVAVDVSLERHYVIAGHTVRLVFAGPALIPYVAPALTHLAAAHGEGPELTIFLWDGASTSVRIPAPPWQPQDHMARGEIRGYNDARILAIFQPDAGAVSMLDVATGQAIYWVSDVRRIPYYESSAPLRTILHWWMSGCEIQLVHAGAVGTSAGGVLIAGKGGSGKSTSALSCLDSALVYAGDDYVLLGAEPSPYVHSIYSSAKLNADHVRRFSNLVPMISNPDRLDTEKAVIYLQDHCPAKLMAGFPVRAILLPRVTGMLNTKLEKISPAASLKALAPSTIFQLPGAGGRALHMMGRLVEKVPSYVLGLGTDIPQIPRAIAGLLAEL